MVRPWHPGIVPPKKQAIFHVSAAEARNEATIAPVFLFRLITELNKTLESTQEVLSGLATEQAATSGGVWYNWPETW